jgi:precorrin-2/cobalt-factor-2 C20-methyltransferase
MTSERETGRLLGVGVGPGDPELVTLKALRAIEEADVVAHFAEQGRASHARAIIEPHLPPGAEELALEYPVTSETSKDKPAHRDAIATFYDEAAATIARHLDADRTVAVITEGDPLFYGSYMYLHVRLSPRYPTEIIAGVSGMAGCWAEAAMPIAQGDDVFTVLPASLAGDALERRLADSNAAVVMKLGRHLAKVRQALAKTGQLARAIYVERGTMAGARMMRLAEKKDDRAPDFAIVLVPGWETRGDAR